METLSLTVEFNHGDWDDGYYEVGSPCFYWNIVPAGTKKYYNRYRYSNSLGVKNIEDPLELPSTKTVREFKGVLEAFQLYVHGSEKDIVVKTIQQAMDSDWSKSFRIENREGHGYISIKYYIDDFDERTPYVFYPTRSQRMTIDDIKFEIGDKPDDYESLTEQELNNAILEKLLTCYRQCTIDKYNKKKTEKEG